MDESELEEGRQKGGIGLSLNALKPLKLRTSGTATGMYPAWVPISWNMDLQALTQTR